MIAGERVVAVVPGRAGSKGLPNKNLRQVGGIPLIGWAIKVALEVTAIDRVIVTTDADDIAQVSRSFGVEVRVRPPELATDRALMVDVLRHLIGELRAEGERAAFMVLLEPTSPLRSADDVRTCLGALAEQRLDSVATFSEADLHPHRAWNIERDRPSVFIPGAVPWLPRQELPPAYQLNGSVYAFVMDRLPAQASGPLFGNAGAVVMEKDRSIDIDDEIDLMVADVLIQRRYLT